MKKHAKLGLAILLMLALLSMPFVIAFAANPPAKTLSVAVLSDIHLFPEAMTGDNNAAY